MLGAPLAHAWNATEERPAELAADYWKMRKELAARQAALAAARIAAVLNGPFS
jgi:hypothetical protein